MHWYHYRNLPPLLSFSALLVCILPHCRLRDWCGNLRKASGHVVCRLDQRHSAFLIPHFTFRIPHSAIPHFTHSLDVLTMSQHSYLFMMHQPRLIYNVACISIFNNATKNANSDNACDKRNKHNITNLSDYYCIIIIINTVTKAFTQLM